MDADEWWEAARRLLRLGLAIQSELSGAGYLVRVIGGTRDASGVGETHLEALQRASWPYLLN